MRWDRLVKDVLRSRVHTFWGERLRHDIEAWTTSVGDDVKRVVQRRWPTALQKQLGFRAMVPVVEIQRVTGQNGLEFKILPQNREFLQWTPAQIISWGEELLTERVRQSRRYLTPAVDYIAVSYEAIGMATSLPSCPVAFLRTLWPNDALPHDEEPTTENVNMNLVDEHNVILAQLVWTVKVRPIWQIADSHVL